MGGACSTRGGEYRILVGNSEGKRPLGTPRHRWRILLKWIFRKWDRGRDWIDLAENRSRWQALVNPVMNVRVP